MSFFFFFPVIDVTVKLSKKKKTPNHLVLFDLCGFWMLSLFWLNWSSHFSSIYLWVSKSFLLFKFEINTQKINLNIIFLVIYIYKKISLNYTFVNSNDEQ